MSFFAMLGNADDRVEIQAITELLDCLNIKGTIITKDAMETQTEIVTEGEEHTEKRYFLIKCMVLVMKHIHVFVVSMMIIILALLGNL